MSSPGNRFPSVEDLPARAALPDPLLRAEGTRIASPESWRDHRATLLDLLLHYEYGHLPPAGAAVQATPVSMRRLDARGGSGASGAPGAIGAIDAIERTLRLGMGPRHDVIADLVLTLPATTRGPLPVIVRGDLGWAPVKPEIAAMVVERGYALVEFNREQIAGDGPARDGVYLAYPQFDGGRIAAWAWGFHRVLDWLCVQDDFDPQRIIATGHSRGGKAALLAGATDTRIALTVPNDSGCGGAGCFRILGPGSEDLAAILDRFPYWFHSRLRDFVGRAERLPFDQHTLKALIAPRALFTTEARGDLWANPEGTLRTHEAAQPVFDMLGASDRIAIHFREGGHEHNADDWSALLDCADAKLPLRR